MNPEQAEWLLRELRALTNMLEKLNDTLRDSFREQNSHLEEIAGVLTTPELPRPHPPSDLEPLEFTR